MADIRPTPVSNYPAYYGAGLLSGLNEAVSKPFGYENDPVRALTNLLGVPSIVKALENTAYGMPNVTGTGMATQLRPEAKEAVGTLLPMAPGAARLAARGAVAGGKYIAPQVGGLLDDYATKTGLQMYAYRPTTPKKPDPSVGTRFVGSIKPTSGSKEIDFLLNKFSTKAESLNLPIEYGSSNISGSRYLTFKNPEGIDYQIRISNHADRHPEQFAAYGERFSIDPQSGNTYKDAINWLKEKGINLNKKVKKQPEQTFQKKYNLSDEDIVSMREYFLNRK